MSLSPLELRIHLFAWICGSIIKGQRLELDRINALSIDTWSLGSLSITHCRMATSSPITERSKKVDEEGTLFSSISEIQDSTDSLRYLARKQPKYAMMPEEMSTSPVKLLYCSPSFAEEACQRLFSPPRPLISFSAVTKRLEHTSNWFCRSSFFCLAVANSDSSLATLSCTACSSAFLMASASSAPFSLASASAKASFLGPTIFATWS
mmetsp:Transcript_74192/g.176935  ORF Transcript_74192/g.176935 Transcript_74192/m.176935 type:complete len:208 (-) Transcript_74192:4580-5203(-)